MKILVTGSAGHLGEALARTLAASAHEVVGLDALQSPFTTVTGSIADAAVVAQAMGGVEAVLHTATLHKPHIVTHSRREFVDTNIVGTLNLLEAAAEARVGSFVYTSTTSVYGLALVPDTGAPADWITEDVVPLPKNIYGVTKKAAEQLCELLQRNLGLPCVVLRTSRFFPDEDDDAAIRRSYADDNVKANEFAYRRVDIEDVVTAHLLAMEHAPALGFRRYVISATTPFTRDDVPRLRSDAPAVLRERFAAYEHGTNAAIEDVSDDRPRLRQCARAARARLVSALVIRLHSGAPRGRRGHSQRLGTQRRIQGLRRRQVPRGNVSNGLSYLLILCGRELGLVQADDT